MRVFLTGATGFIGSPVARTLLAAGHEVTGLCRTPARAAGLARDGMEVLGGDLADPDTYARVAGVHDVAVHAGVDYGGDTPAVDRVALDALLGGAGGGGRARRLIYTSGLWVLGDTGGRDAAEDAGTERPASVSAWRVPHEKVVLDAVERGVSAVVLRPGFVYGGRGSLSAAWYRGAVEDGAAPLVGEGDNHWSFVEREDLARLYLALVESDAVGVFHGADNHPVRARDAVGAASRAAGAGGRVRRLSLEEARASLGQVADAMVLDQRMVTARADEVGWSVRCESYPACVGQAFEEWKAARG
ncbi:MAG TPA: NAD-dependent epimerase/dehydratase family protein [Longimicrobiales bacterium]|nr:NAD-dependent epimerase/dehydratase family protein [Longimicrobiales bacterium]